MRSAKGGEKLPPKRSSKKKAAEVKKYIKRTSARSHSDTPPPVGTTKLSSIGHETTKMPVDRGNLPDNATPLRALTEKHIYFAKRYVLNGGNACKAARESGFNEWYGSNLLVNNPLIIKEIDRYRKTRANRFEVNANRVIAELTRVAFGTLGDFLQVQKDGTPVIDCTEIGPDEMAALAEITQDSYSERQATGDGNYESVAVKKTKIKLHSKVAALDQLARIFKLYSEGDGKDQTPEEKAARIKAALEKMNEVDGVKEK